MRFPMHQRWAKWCASVAVAVAALLNGCSAAPTAAPFDPGAPAAATAREEATRVAAAQQTQIAAPAATQAYLAESDALDNRERALRLSEQEHALIVQQQQDYLDIERQQALIPPMATRASAEASTQIALAQGAGTLPLIGIAVLVIVSTGGIVWLFNLERREREKTGQEHERTRQEQARRIEIEARAYAPREPVPGLVQIYNVNAGIWITQARQPGSAAPVMASQPELSDPYTDHAQRHRWHRTLYLFARHLEARARSGTPTSRRLMKMDGVCEENAWNQLTDALASVGALSKQQGVQARLAQDVSALFVRDQFTAGYWSLPQATYRTEPPDIAAVSNRVGIVEVDAQGNETIEVDIREQYPH